MKHFKWPRPPLVLGFILGSILERYMFISIERYGTEWLARPLVLVLLVMATLTLFRPVIQDYRTHGGFKGVVSGFQPPHLAWSMLFPLALLIIVAVMMREAMTWNFKARIVPTIVGTGALIFTALSLFNQMFRERLGTEEAALAEQAKAAVSGKIHMDIASNIGHLSTETILFRGAMFFAWMLAFMGSMALIGLIPTVPIFIIAYMRVEGREPWLLTLGMAVCTSVFIWVLFDWLLTIPWPPSLLGDVFPQLKWIPSV